MQEFDTIEEAFRWFLENEYPKLSSKQKLEIKDAKYSFYKEGRKVSEKRMKRILSDYGYFSVVYRFEGKSE
ncbi:hypothetical protein [Microscilla marina]|uniref:Uncharacterized protein n=1 Tax=Microscilla marina ATCC 23134 TaxID=313606 RepID=A1ZMY8_MICM2|nr:hypothetical protein [Microscilla marina]EAY28169.1 hypothetical protein M23134_03430 [Microscilla marina ATCC 23134]